MNHSFALGTHHCPRKLGQKILRTGKQIVYYSEYHFTSPSHGKTSLSLPPRACWKKKHLWWWRKRTFTVVTERRITYHISIPGEKGCLTSLILSLVEDWWALGLYWKAWWTCLCSPILSGICALQDLGVTRQTYNPPCDILVNRDYIFMPPSQMGVLWSMPWQTWNHRPNPAHLPGTRNNWNI